jgi:hypothetical protein
MIKRKILFALSTLLVSAAPQVAFAGDYDQGAQGSLDSMWIEPSPKSDAPPAATPAAKTADETATPDKQVEQSEAPAAGTTTTTASDDTAAPMCTLQTFKASDIVSKGGWPGVGPFNPEADNNFFDEHHNKLHVDVSGEQITRAQLDLSNRQLSGDAGKDLLDMQMNIDFFLEAVGIKPVKIQDLNSELSKYKEALLKIDDAPLNLRAGRCAVTIEKHHAADGNKMDYVIAVSSLDANQQVLKEHSVTERTTRATTPTKQPEPIAISQPAQTAVSTPSVVKQPAVSDAALKDQFAAVIASWQKIKKNAVRNKQTEELANVLAGKALIRQTDAVKWLVTNKKYYDMNPKGVTVDQFAVLAPAKKYMVAAQVHEAYKFIDEPSGKVLKEVDDINKVNYTIEKIAGKWVITDSALLAPAMIATPKPKTTR